MTTLQWWIVDSLAACYTAGFMAVYVMSRLTGANGTGRIKSAGLGLVWPVVVVMEYLQKREL